MTAVAAPPLGLRRVLSCRIRDRRKPLKSFVVFAVMKDGPATSSDAEKEGGLSGDLGSGPIVPRLKMSSGQSNQAPRIPQIEAIAMGSPLRFNRPQPSDDEFDWEHKRAFGRFFAREALLDEELWAAAWLRAEGHWENRSYVRNVETYKGQFANRVKKDEENVKRTVLKSIVGTLDLSIQHLLYGETFPGERMKQPASCNIYQTDQPKYAYVANLCVAKHYRRQGVATNMLLLAIEAATSYGTNQVFVHVLKDNTGAQKLYDQIGFQIVKEAVPHLLADDKHLLCIKV